jgi:hypothetical protein
MKRVSWLVIVGFLGALTACGNGTNRAADATGQDGALDVRDDEPIDDDGTGYADDAPRDDREATDDHGDAAADSVLDAAPDATPDASPPTGPVHFAVVSDTHMTGDPNDPLNRRFDTIARALAASSTPPERLFVTGDVIDDFLAVKDYVQDWLDGAGDPVPVLVEMRRLADTLLPGRIRFALGNHDNRFIDQFQGNEVPLAAWLRAFEGSPSFPAPWYAEDIRGCRFVVLWSCEMATNHDDNDRPTFGEEQLAWLREQLDDGLPTVVFWHHWIGPWDDPSPPPPLLQALANNPTAADRVTFTGHSHDWRHHEWQGVRFYQTAALRDLPDAVHHVVCDGDAGTITVTNEDDIPYAD